MSDYTITIQDPQGHVVLTARVDAATRRIEAQVKAEHLRPLLITTAVLSGHVAGVLTEHESRARLPVTPTSPVSLKGVVHGPDTGVGATLSNGSMKKHLSEDDLQELSERKGALESITVADRDWILAGVLLRSLEDDLAAAHANGWWRQDPAEMLAQPPRHLRIRSGHVRPVQGAHLANELDSPAIERLYEIIRGCTGGRMSAGRGTVIRNARRKALTHGHLVRRRRAKNIQLEATA